jgi:hypothetical protein
VLVTVKLTGAVEVMEREVGLTVASPVTTRDTTKGELAGAALAETATVVEPVAKMDESAGETERDACGKIVTDTGAMGTYWPVVCVRLKLKETA